MRMTSGGMLPTAAPSHGSVDGRLKELSRLLQPVDASSSAAFIYDASTGQNFTCSDYPALNRFLAKSLLESDLNHHLMIDWTRCLTHPLIFDINTEYSRDSTYTNLNLYDKFIGMLKVYLRLNNVTVIVSMHRSKCGGMRIHFPDVEMAHDDYIHLCLLIRSGCEMNENGMRLDCPSRMHLVANGNDPDGPYEPAFLIHYPEKPYRWKRLKEHYQMFKNNASQPQGSIDEPSVLVFEDPLNFREQMEATACRMSPVPQEGNPNVICLEFPTRVVGDKLDISSIQFTYGIRECGLLKDDRLRPSSPGAGSFAYRFLKEKSDFIQKVHSIENGALKAWYNQFSTRSSAGKLQTVDLGEKWRSLRYQSPSPLHTVLLLSERALPTFYTIYNVLKRKHGPEVVAQKVSRLLSGKLVPEDCLTLNMIWYMGLSRLDLDSVQKCWKKECKKSEKTWNRLEKLKLHFLRTKCFESVIKI